MGRVSVTTRTIRDFDCDLDVSAITGAWAARHGLVRVATSGPGEDLFFADWTRSGRKRPASQADPGWDRGLLVSVRQSEKCHVHLEAWVSPGAGGFPLLVPREIRLEPGVRGWAARSAGRRIVDDLLTNLGQPGIERGSRPEPSSQQDRSGSGLGAWLFPDGPRNTSGRTSAGDRLRQQPRVSDPELGQCMLVGCSRWWIACLAIGVGMLMFQVASGDLVPSGPARLSSPFSQSITITVGGLFFVGVAIWTRATSLLIGERGFAFRRPFRSIQATWPNVREVAIERRSVLVSLDVNGRGRRVRLSSDLSASPFVVAELMNEFRGQHLDRIQPGSA